MVPKTSAWFAGRLAKGRQVFGRALEIEQRRKVLEDQMGSTRPCFNANGACGVTRSPVCAHERPRLRRAAPVTAAAPG
jgi:hypothetical protein